ncbi:MAG: tetratricopeptide repeat protein [Candidatus Wallbacteria bacterium]|nr:tetratricopeptide repeat protein [Candidatus Wallbacteria bacterium]
MALFLISILFIYFKYIYCIERFYLDGVEKFNHSDYKGSLAEFSKVIEIDQFHVSANLYLARIYEALNNVEEAGKTYHRLLSIHPDNIRNQVAIFQNLGELYQKNRQFDKAFLEFKKVLELDGALYRTHLYLGMFFAGQSMLDEAFWEFQKAVEVEPSGWDAHLYLGLCYCKKNWREEARREFQKIIDCSSDYPRAHLYLGYLLKDEKSQAVPEFETIPNLETVIGHPCKYDIPMLQQQFEIWRRGNELQSMGKIRTVRELTRQNAVTFKKTGSRILNHLKLQVDEEQMRPRGINYIAHPDSDDRHRVLVYLRNWMTCAGPEAVYEMLAEMRRKNAEIGIYVSCGSFTLEAKNIAKTLKIKLLGRKTLNRILLELA